MPCHGGNWVAGQAATAFGGRIWHPCSCGHQGQGWHTRSPRLPDPAHQWTARYGGCCPWTQALADPLIFVAFMCLEITMRRPMIVCMSKSNCFCPIQPNGLNKCWHHLGSLSPSMFTDIKCWTFCVPCLAQSLSFHNYLFWFVFAMGQFYEKKWAFSLCKHVFLPLWSLIVSCWRAFNFESLSNFVLHPKVGQTVNFWSVQHWTKGL